MPNYSESLLVLFCLVLISPHSILALNEIHHEVYEISFPLTPFASYTYAYHSFLVYTMYIKL